MFLSIIAAIGNQRQLGLNGSLRWSLQGDLENFKKITLHHPIIMGRKTFESIGHSLPNRINIILTRNKNYFAEWCLIFHNIYDAIEYCKNYDEVFIIGGSQIYDMVLRDSALPLKKLYLTVVDYNGPADVFFPEIDLYKWKLLTREFYRKDKNNSNNYKIEVWKRTMERF